MAMSSLTDNNGPIINTVGSQAFAVQSSRARQLPSSYISNIINASVAAGDAINDNNMFENSDQVFFKEMAGRVREQGFTNNAFLTSLISKTNFSHTGSITWGELSSLYPEINSDSVTTIERPRPGTSVIDYRTFTHHNRGFSFENQAVAIVQNILPAIMTSHMIHQVAFTLTNETVDGSYQYIPSSIVPMTNKINVPVKMNGLKDQILNQLAPAIAGGNGFVFFVQVSANVLTEMTINIRLNGGSPMEVAVPLYADSTFSCFGYATRQELDHVTHEMNVLTNAINGKMGVDQGYYETMASSYNDLDPIKMDSHNFDPLNNVSFNLQSGAGSSFSDDPMCINR
jgi:hypothetical protein